MNEELSKKLGNLYDDLPVGVLVVSKDDEERILYHNKQILDIMQCKNNLSSGIFALVFNFKAIS